jgi:hypothetical protein
MSENRVLQAGAGSAPKTAVASLILGIAAFVLMVGAVAVGILVEVIGILSLLRGVVIPVSVAAVIFGIVARRSICAEGLQGKRAATTGLVLGSTVLIVSVLFSVLTALFFSLMLFSR